tara:strand:- start:2781 stop:3629 length:849 start_codon:yes stop_codon:yes gene_type:complete
MKLFIRNNLFFLFAFLLVSSCETISSIPEKIIDVSTDTFDYVGSVFTGDKENEVSQSNEEAKDSLKSDQNMNIDKSLKSEKSEEIVNDRKLSLDESSEVLESVKPVEVEKKVVKKKTIEKEFDSPLKKEENDQSVDIQKNTKKEIINLEEIEKSDKKELKLKNKIQFKIATINFRSGSSTINSKGHKKIKKVLRLALAKNAKIKIVGHASTRTKDMDIISHKLLNFKISDERAHSVAAVFIKNNFPLERLITEAVSDSKPLFHEVMPAGTYANQRTEIYLIY